MENKEAKHAILIKTENILRKHLGNASIELENENIDIGYFLSELLYIITAYYFELFTDNAPMILANALNERTTIETLCLNGEQTFMVEQGNATIN